MQGLKELKVQGSSLPTHALYAEVLVMVVPESY